MSENRELKNKEMRLVCPHCNRELDSKDEGFFCNKCSRTYPVVDGIPVFVDSPERIESDFYDEWYKDPYKVYNIDGIGRIIKMSPFINKFDFFFRHVLYTQFKRTRFFKRAMRKLRKSSRNSSPNILDIGCGRGDPEAINETVNSGIIYGVDLSLVALKGGYAEKCYRLLINADAAKLPFGTETFDCVVSSDLIGHIPAEKKDAAFLEMNRVLKRGGITAHIIETDNDSFIRKFAKRYPDLYQKYFIEGIGGHFGLEKPSAVIQRLRSAGMEPVSVRKYYTYVWDIESFIGLFDNEYKEKSSLLRAVLSLYKLACRNFAIKVVATSLTGAVAFIVDMISPLEKAEGIMVICVKK